MAQLSQRSTETITFSSGQSDIRIKGDLPFPDQGPFFSYFLEWEAGPLDAAIRFSPDGSEWSDWNTFTRDSHNTEKAIADLQFGQADYRYYELRIDSRQAQTQSAILHFYQPGHTPAPTVITDSFNPTGPLACPCPLPEIQLRSQWCPDGSCPVGTELIPTTVTHLIVHHSAGTNIASDWAAVVRAVWDQHVNGNGWDDIGYNYLVDPNGVIYEGRGNNIRGAHFCGMNTATMGTCVLGNFTDITPTETAINSLERLLAWKSCDIGADPLGESFHTASNGILKNIAGHRDGCNTACPGDAFYPLLPQVRQGVQNKILAECSGLATPISLSATEVSETAYFLTWAHNSPEEEGFFLEWSQDGGDNYELRAQLAANTLNFFEDQLELEQIYLYRIRAFNDVDTSEYSNVVTINTGVVSTDNATLPKSSLVVSPNPANEWVQLDLHTTEQGILQYQLLDLGRRIIQEKQILKNSNHWQQQLDVRTLPSGIYLLRIQLNGQQGVWKIVKQ
jgi:hypothetical protein